MTANAWNEVFGPRRFRHPAYWAAMALAVLAAMALAGSGCAPIGGAGNNASPSDQKIDDGKKLDPDLHPAPRPAPSPSSRSEAAKQLDQSFIAYRKGMAESWRSAAASNPKSWDEAYSRVKKGNYEARQKAFSPFESEISKLEANGEFSPEKFRLMVDQVAKWLEE